MRTTEPGSRAATRRGREPTPGERRLAESRAAIAALLDDSRPDSFPRSRTMRFLMSDGGRVVALGAFAGFLAAKPKFALSLLRLAPLGSLLPIARILQSLR